MKTTRLSELLSRTLVASLLAAAPAGAQALSMAPSPAAAPAEVTAPDPALRSEAVDPVTPIPLAPAAPQADAPGPANPDGQDACAPVAPSAADPAPANPAPPAPAAPPAKRRPRNAAPAAPPAPTPAPTATRIAPADGTGVHVQVMDVTVTGDEFMDDPATGNVIVTGNPRAVRGTDEIRATRLIINRRTQQVTAEGDVIIRRGNQEFHASRATYTFPEQSGQADNVHSQFQNVFLDAEQIFFKPGGVYEYRKTRVTTCDRPRPHYLFSSRSVDVIPGERMIVHRAGLDLLGMRLFTLPTFEKNLARSGDEAASLIPSFGYDRHNGPYARKEFPLIQRSPVWLFGDVQLNTFREPQGGLVASTAGRLQWVGALFYRDVAENQRSPHLQVSRLPEVGVVWSPSDVPRPGRFLPNQVTALNIPKGLELSQRWHFAASATAGYFQQYRGDGDHIPGNITHDGSRLQAQAQALLPLLKLGPLKLNGLRFMARQSIYDRGDGYTLLGTGIGKKFRVGPNFTVGLERFDQWTSGHTPFLFDEAELRDEWRPRIEYHTRGTNILYYARLRNNGDRFDQVFAISHLFHCIEPRLTYRVRRQEVFLEFRIPGLAGFGRSAAGEPRSQESEDPQRPVRPAPVQSQPQ